MKPVVAKSLDIARAQLGVREVGTSNRGAEVDAYLKSVGLPPGQPWCAAFVYWCAEKAAQQLDVANVLPKTGWTPAIQLWGRQHGCLYTRPEPGDLMLVHYPNLGRIGHVGYVEEVSGSRVRTIEGNTNLGASRSGIGVFRLDRPVTTRLSFVRWDQVAPAGDALPAERLVPLVVEGAGWGTVPLFAGESLVPVRLLAEHYGRTVGWDQESQAVLLNGEPLEAPVVLRQTDQGPTAYAPTRAVAAALDLQAGYDGRVLLKRRR